MSKFIPFENGEEFTDSYSLSAYKLSRRKIPNHYLSYIHSMGFCLHNKYRNSYVMVVEICKNGLVLGSDNEVTSWKELLEGYTFLSGHPCGKWENKNDY